MAVPPVTAESPVLPLGDPTLVETRESTVLAEGVTLTRIVRGRKHARESEIQTTTRGPWRVNVLEIDPTLAAGTLRTQHRHEDAAPGAAADRDALIDPLLCLDDDDARAQQRRFTAFRREYNYVRPHEGIGQRTPASLYEPSPRPYPNKEPRIEYPGNMEIRRVSRNGGVRWAKRWLNISSVLAEENVGFEEVDDGIWSLYFGAMLLGRFDERKFRLYAAAPYQRQTKEMGRTSRVRRGRV